jgi:hypothetical protein
MLSALKAAGFLGVEAEGAVIHARLWAASTSFTATPEAGDLWLLALSWPLRASAAQIAGWNIMHPDQQMDISAGETRICMRLRTGDLAGLQLWGAVAEEAVAHFVRWRRAQRAPGEGM